MKLYSNRHLLGPNIIEIHFNKALHSPMRSVDRLVDESGAESSVLRFRKLNERIPKMKR